MPDARLGISKLMPDKGRAALRAGTLGALALLFAALPGIGAALGSAWSEREFARFRLLPGTTAPDGSGQVLIGLEVELASGWQFYSNEPGAFGVAPIFDWSESRNLARASVHWPRPTAYVYSIDPPITTRGYKGSLLLPIVLEAARAGEASDLRLVLEYAVCNEFCVLDRVALSLTLPAGPGDATPDGARLRSALAGARVDAR